MATAEKCPDVHHRLVGEERAFRIEDESVFQGFEKDELDEPSIRHYDHNRAVYQSRDLRLPKKTGPPVLCDFGEARFGKASYTEDIQPYVYRAPEVILDSMVVQR